MLWHEKSCVSVAHNQMFLGNSLCVEQTRRVPSGVWYVSCLSTPFVRLVFQIIGAMAFSRVSVWAIG